MTMDACLISESSQAWCNPLVCVSRNGVHRHAALFQHLESGRCGEVVGSGDHAVGGPDEYRCGIERHEAAIATGAESTGEAKAIILEWNSTGAWPAMETSRGPQEFQL